MSGYRIATNFGAAEVGFHGSFWADPETFDPVRLDVVANDIPGFIKLTEAANRIDYARMRIGSSDVLLPQSGELRTHEAQGWENRNQISFTHCREYGVESVIRFDDVGDSSGSTSASGSRFTVLPPGLPLTLTLETAIEAATAHIGDLISARVDADVRVKGKVAVPKDAVVSGRLRRMEIHKEGWPYVLAGLEFTQIEFEGKQARFFAELEKVILPPGAEGPKRAGIRITGGPKVNDARDLPGVGVVSAMGSSLRLPHGTRMLWKTISYAQAAEEGK